MGGRGSGRRYQGGKRTTSDMLRLDVRLLQRKEWLMPGRLIDLNWSSNGTGEVLSKCEPMPTT